MKTNLFKNVFQHLEQKNRILKLGGVYIDQNNVSFFATEQFNAHLD
jgi:hypothetical protein